MIKLLSRKTVLEEQLFTVYQDEVELPSGEKRLYHNVQRDPAISVFPLTPDNEIYLIRQHRYLYNEILLEGIAGFIDKNEKPEDTARRELKEEAGITPSELIQISTMSAAGSIVTWEHPIFVAKGLSFGDTAMEESEDITLVKMPIQVAIENVINGTIKTAASMVGILLVDRLIRDGKL